MTGQTLQKAMVPLPGGAVAVYGPSGLLYYGHSDHLGSIRLGSTPTRTLSFDLAYGPFGETYAVSGSTDPTFTGHRQDTVPGLFDSPAREYSNEGRWASPDPAGIAEANLNNPQSLNRYAYVGNNPLALTDPTGLAQECRNSGSCKPPASGGCISTCGYGGGFSWYPDDQAFFDAMETGASGYDVFDAIAGAPGTHFSYDIYGHLQWGFSVTAWQQWVSQNYSHVGYTFTGGDGSILDSQKQLAAIQFGQQACSGQATGAVASCIQQAYDTMGVATDNNGNPAIEGGNYEFTYASIQINGQSVNPEEFGCVFSRCGTFDSLDYSHGDGTFHVDTANPWFVPIGSIAHLLVDIVGGNTWWSGGIRRNP
jgi:RHS repeat-associated protein